MAYKALLTLDLENGVSSDKRLKVYEYLEHEKWVKIKALAATWRCSFSENSDRETAVRICKKDVTDAVKYAGVYSYNAAVQVGMGDVEVF